jgi:hypothetical protein
MAHFKLYFPGGDYSEQSVSMPYNFEASALYTNSGITTHKLCDNIKRAVTEYVGEIWVY